MSDEKIVSLAWDGEQIKQSVESQAENFTPKVMLDAIKQGKEHLGQIEAQKIKLKSNIKQVERDIVSINEYLKKRMPFEEKCTELQLKKLNDLIAVIHTDCVKEAIVQTEIEVAKDPNAYVDPKVTVNTKYVKYQNLLATNKDVANKICRHIIIEHLFEKPIFKNPFLD